MTVTRFGRIFEIEENAFEDAFAALQDLQQKHLSPNQQFGLFWPPFWSPFWFPFGSFWCRWVRSDGEPLRHSEELSGDSDAAAGERLLPEDARIEAGFEAAS